MPEEGSYSRRVQIDWTRVPTKSELAASYGTRTRVVEGAVPPPLPLSFGAALGFGPDDYFEHESSVVAEVKEMYASRGFDTDVLLQDPFGHDCPTVACPIGFPSNLHRRYPELRRYNKWICRIHVEIARNEESGKLISVPHIEVDPAFHAMDHLTDTFLSGHVVRGPVAVAILKSFEIV